MKNSSSGRYMFKNQDKLMSYKITYDSFDEIREILLFIIETMPPDWKPVQYKEEIATIIAQRIKSRKIFDTVDFVKCECLY